MQTPEGRLKPNDRWAFGNPEDQEGGSGLSYTRRDYVAMVADLVSESPQLLKPATRAGMFTPQLAAKSPSVQMLLGLRPAWDIISGPIAEDSVTVWGGYCAWTMRPR